MPTLDLRVCEVKNLSTAHGVIRPVPFAVVRLVNVNTGNILASQSSKPLELNLSSNPDLDAVFQFVIQNNQDVLSAVLEVSVLDKGLLANREMITVRVGPLGSLPQLLQGVVWDAFHTAKGPLSAEQYDGLDDSTPKLRLRILAHDFGVSSAAAAFAFPVATAATFPNGSFEMQYRDCFPVAQPVTMMTNAGYAAPAAAAAAWSGEPIVAAAVVDYPPPSSSSQQPQCKKEQPQVPLF